MKTALPAWTALVVALVAAAMLAASGPGTRYELWSYRVGFELLRYGAWVGAGAGVVSIVFLLVKKTRTGNIAKLLLALIIGAVCLALPLQFRSRAASVPRINDISTDFANPATAEEQKKGYPDIAPLVLPLPPDQAYSRALAAAEAMGWRIVKNDARGRRLEAVDTTAWFAFKDDIEVRVTPAGSESRIDVRSRSRVGRGDFGINAKRIRAYIGRLK